MHTIIALAVSIVAVVAATALYFYALGREDA